MTDLSDRTFDFALRVVRLIAKLPRIKVADVLGNQLLRAGTSVGANWQEAVAASSQADFSYRVSVCEREARESNYWLRLLQSAQVLDDPEIPALTQESRELVAIFTSIGRKSKRKE